MTRDTLLTSYSEALDMNAALLNCLDHVMMQVKFGKSRSEIMATISEGLKQASGRVPEKTDLFETIASATRPVREYAELPR